MSTVASGMQTTEIQGTIVHWPVVIFIYIIYVYNTAHPNGIGIMHCSVRMMRGTSSMAATSPPSMLQQPMSCVGRQTRMGMLLQSLAKWFRGSPPPSRV